MRLELEIPLRLRHHANALGNWRARAFGAKRLRELVRGHLATFGKARPSIPCRVTMTRGAPRRYDSDNMIHACKPIRDQIAKWLGVDDRYDEIVEYVCRQQQTRKGVYFVRITFEDKPGDPYDIQAAPTTQFTRPVQPVRAHPEPKSAVRYIR